jgi:hypothetical protein
MVERLREGDQQAFDTFYWQYIDQVASYFMKRTPAPFITNLLHMKANNENIFMYYLMHC